MPGITLIFTALHALLLVALAAPIVAHRLRRDIGLGDGADPQLLRHIRVHGNFIEYVPLALLLLALLELAGLDPRWLWTFGVTLLVARLLHAFGLRRSAGSSPGRALGAILTFLDLIAMAGTALWMALR